MSDLISFLTDGKRMFENDESTESDDGEEPNADSVEDQNCNNVTNIKHKGELLHCATSCSMLSTSN